MWLGNFCKTFNSACIDFKWIKSSNYIILATKLSLGLFTSHARTTYPNDPSPKISDYSKEIK